MINDYQRYIEIQIGCSMNLTSLYAIIIILKIDAKAKTTNTVIREYEEIKEKRRDENNMTFPLDHSTVKSINN